MASKVDLPPPPSRESIPEAPPSSFRLSRLPAVLPYLTRRRLEREVALALLPVLVVTGLAGLAYAVGAHRLLGTIDPRVWGVLAAGMAVLVVGCAAGSRVALFFSMLFGVPLELPFRVLGTDAEVLRRRARWLVSFLREKPRGYNTRGAHLAYGAIATKVDLKRLCVRHERADHSLGELQKEREQERQRELTAHDDVVRALRTSGPEEARDPSLRAGAIEARIAILDEAILARRLSVQEAVLAQLRRALKEAQKELPLSEAVAASLHAQFASPKGEPKTLLPRGLLRGAAAYTFEYGMFAGRVLMATLFLVAFQGSLGWALILWVLALYVGEPVVLKLHIAFFNLLLDSPGHEMLDLRQYLAGLPEGALCRVPITVPKFSSNPAWAALSEAIDAAARASSVTPAKVTPLAMRRGVSDTVIELTKEADAPPFAEALRVAIERAGATLPLRTRVEARGARVVLSLDTPAEHVWAWIGEDAGQASLYLERNLDNLGDTLAYAGPKLRPVFILASNTKDPDAAEREVVLIQALQARADAAYGGQVGFLYLHRGGEWFDFNAQLERFDPKDKDFLRALPSFRKALAEGVPALEPFMAGRDPSTLDALSVAAVFNAALASSDFHRAFGKVDLGALPLHLRPSDEAREAVARRLRGEALTPQGTRASNRELLFTVCPPRVLGGFFKKVGNDIPVQELLVRGKTRPQAYTTRALSEHVQDPSVPSFTRVWGDFARYTDLVGDNQAIARAILAGDDLRVSSVPEVGAVIDDKNDFAPGEFEKGLTTMLHPSNRHIVLGIPRINVTCPEARGPGQPGRTLSSKYLAAAQAAREIHNSSDGQSRTRVFEYASPAYGKWWMRPEPYLAHYNREVLNAAHALSHDFQQSYLVTGAADRLNGFSEALYGPTRFRIDLISAKRAAKGQLVG